MEHTKSLKGLIDHRSDINSLYGENGILNELLMRLNLNNGNLIEFGAHTGEEWSNTIHLLKKGWHGLYIEPERKKLGKLVETSKNYPNMRISDISIITENMKYRYTGLTLDEIIRLFFKDQDVQLISIDIDSYDYYIFKGLEYRPEVIIIEINAFFPPNVRYIDRQRKDIYGTSHLSMLDMAAEKDYHLVACAGCNHFYVRGDIYRQYEPANPEFDWTLINKDNFTHIL